MRRYYRSTFKRLCALCGKRLPPKSHRLRRYHVECKAEVVRDYKRRCWHRHKAEYRRDYR